MAGTPTFTADTVLTGSTLTGTMSIANSGTTITGFGTKFNTELRIGDSITFTTDAGSSITRIVEGIISDTSMEVSVAVGGSDVSTKSSVSRNRTTLNDTDKNVSLFKLPYDNINSGNN